MDDEGALALLEAILKRALDDATLPTSEDPDQERRRQRERIEARGFLLDWGTVFVRFIGGDAGEWQAHVLALPLRSPQRRKMYRRVA